MRSGRVKNRHRDGEGNVAVRTGVAIPSIGMPFSKCWKEEHMQEKRRVLYKKGVFVCPTCRQSYVQEKWIEEWRIRCHRCTYRGTLTEVSVEEHIEEETFRR